MITVFDFPFLELFTLEIVAHFRYPMNSYCQNVKKSMIFGADAEWKCEKGSETENQSVFNGLEL